MSYILFEIKNSIAFITLNRPDKFNSFNREMALLMQEALDKAGKTIEDLDMFIPHQANLRIAQFVQQKFGLPDEKIHNNIQKYGNTTAASIPIALSEAIEEGKIKRGDLVLLSAFGSGFTWGSVLFEY